MIGDEDGWDLDGWCEHCIDREARQLCAACSVHLQVGRQSPQGIDVTCDGEGAGG